jgi:rubredoxin
LKKWICTICGFVYDEALGDPDGGIASGTKWEDIPDEWVCPTCGAVKSDFEEQVEKASSGESAHSFEEDDDEELRELSFGELSALCSNLSKGCEKQYRTREAELFNKLAEFYKEKSSSFEEDQLSDIVSLIGQDLSESYPQADETASAAGDRGALRALVWGDKVTKILKSLLTRYEKQSDALLDGTRVYVCEICGFIYVGNDLPEICPVCKVTNRKMTEIKREVK